MSSILAWRNKLNCNVFVVAYGSWGLKCWFWEKNTDVMGMCWWCRITCVINKSNIKQISHWCPRNLFGLFGDMEWSVMLSRLNIKLVHASKLLFSIVCYVKSNQFSRLLRSGYLFFIDNTFLFWLVRSNKMCNDLQWLLHSLILTYCYSFWCRFTFSWYIFQL